MYNLRLVLVSISTHRLTRLWIRTRPRKASLALRQRPKRRSECRSRSPRRSKRRCPRCLPLQESLDCGKPRRWPEGTCQRAKPMFPPPSPHEISTPTALGADNPAWQWPAPAAPAATSPAAQAWEFARPLTPIYAQTERCLQPKTGGIPSLKGDRANSNKCAYKGITSAHRAASLVSVTLILTCGLSERTGILEARIRRIEGKRPAVPRCVAGHPRLALVRIRINPPWGGRPQPQPQPKPAPASSKQISAHPQHWLILCRICSVSMMASSG